MKNTQKGFVVPLLIAIIALLLAGGGVYLYGQKNLGKQLADWGSGFKATTTPESNFGTQTQNETKTLSDEQTLQIAKKVINEYFNIKTDSVCLLFNSNKSDGYVFYLVTRKFINGCPGSPDSAPTLPRIKIDLITGESFSQDVGGEYHPIKTSNSQTVGWKTFVDNKSGISMSFPKEFVASDGVEDFVYESTGGYETKNKNSEYFSYCDKKSLNQLSSNPIDSCAKGHYYYFGINIQNRVIDKSLIDSWGYEVFSSKEVVINGKKAWVIKMCAGSGCSVSVDFTHGTSTVSVTFYEHRMLTDDSRPLLLSELGERILKTLKFTN